MENFALTSPNGFPFTASAVSPRNGRDPLSRRDVSRGKRQSRLTRGPRIPRGGRKALGRALGIHFCILIRRTKGQSAREMTFLSCPKLGRQEKEGGEGEEIFLTEIRAFVTLPRGRIEQAGFSISRTSTHALRPSSKEQEFRGPIVPTGRPRKRRPPQEFRRGSPAKIIYQIRHGAYVYIYTPNKIAETLTADAHRWIRAYLAPTNRSTIIIPVAHTIEAIPARAGSASARGRLASCRYRRRRRRPPVRARLGTNPRNAR